jgi:hypothetical protein
LLASIPPTHKEPNWGFLETNPNAITITRLPPLLLPTTKEEKEKK